MRGSRRSSDASRAGVTYPPFAHNGTSIARAKLLAMRAMRRRASCARKIRRFDLGSIVLQHAGPF